MRQLALRVLAATFKTIWFICLVGVVIVPCAAVAAPGAELSQAAISLLKQHCLRCHNDEKQRGELDLSTLKTALLGGGQGGALVPHQPDKSLLFARAQDGSMPPEVDGRRLSAQEVKILADWISAGAKWSENSAVLVPAAQKTAPAANPVDQLQSELSLRWPDSFGPAVLPDVRNCRAFRQRRLWGKARSQHN